MHSCQIICRVRTPTLSYLQPHIFGTFKIGAEAANCATLILLIIIVITIIIIIIVIIAIVSVVIIIIVITEMLELDSACHCAISSKP